MGTIDETGFLSDEIQVWIEKHRSNNNDWFCLADSVNKLAQQLLLSLEPQKDDEQALLVLLLFSRVVSHFQGTVLLSERGMVAEARSLLRGMLDATFAEVALSKHRELVKEFIADDVYQRLKFVNCFRALPKVIKRRHRLGEKKLAKLAAELKFQIESQGIKPLTAEYLAQKADMLGHYNTMFVLLSSSTHSRVRDMERHFELGKHEEIEGLKWGPDVTDLDEILIPACECLFIAARAAADLFQFRKIDVGLQRDWQTYERLFGKSA